MSAQPMLQLPVTVDATNALVIVVEAIVTNPASTGFSAPTPLARIPVSVDASNRLVVTFA